MQSQLVFLVPSPSKEFINKFSEFENTIFIEKIQDFAEIKELKNDQEKVLIVDPDFVEWELDKTKLEQVVNLKAVFLLSTSFSWVDLEFCTSKDISVSNIKNWSTNAVADWAVMYSLNLIRKVPILLKGEQKDVFHSIELGTELVDKKVGIIGLGNIGLAIADKLSSLGAKVYYWSNSPKKTEYEYQDLATIFNSSDLIFPCLAENVATKEILTDDLLQSMKSESYFISIIHHFYNHNLLLEMVKNGKIAGYAFEKSEAKITEFEGNIFVLPSYAWFTTESLQNMEEKLYQNLKAYILDGSFISKVN